MDVVQHDVIVRIINEDTRLKFDYQALDYRSDGSLAKMKGKIAEVMSLQLGCWGFPNASQANNNFHLL